MKKRMDSSFLDEILSKEKPRRKQIHAFVDVEVFDAARKISKEANIDWTETLNASLRLFIQAAQSYKKK